MADHEFHEGGAFGAFDTPNYNLSAGPGLQYETRDVYMDDVAVANAAAGRKPPSSTENAFTALQAIEAPPELPQSTIRPPGVPGAARSSPSGAPGASIAKLAGLLNSGSPRGSPTAPGGIPSLGELIGKI